MIKLLTIILKTEYEANNQVQIMTIYLNLKIILPCFIGPKVTMSRIELYKIKSLTYDFLTDHQKAHTIRLKISCFSSLYYFGRLLIAALITLTPLPRRQA